MSDDLPSLHHSVIGLDVHQAKINACWIHQNEQGEKTVEHREFGGFQRDRRALAQWAAACHPEIVVMESTGIYWRSPYAALERVGLRAWVVNARHVKTVPGRKTDVADAQWLAVLARAGLLRASFIPEAAIREARLIAHYRQKVVGMLSAEKNRLHKVLADTGIRLNVLVSDLHGKTARSMVKALVAGRSTADLVAMAGLLRADRQELREALQAESWSVTHRALLGHILLHIEMLEAQVATLDAELAEQLRPWQASLQLLQTLPGIDAPGAALLLAEIGGDMGCFGSAERLASWAGICPGNNESAGKRKSGRIRQGNVWLKRLLCEMAQAAARTRCSLKAKFESLSARKGYKKSVVALAHKMLRIIYAMLSKNQPYRDASVNYEELMVERNAPRWLKMLGKYGYLAPQPA